LAYYGLLIDLTGHGSVWWSTRKIAILVYQQGAAVKNIGLPDSSSTCYGKAAPGNAITSKKLQNP
jgi:hypothetical protein